MRTDEAAAVQEMHDNLTAEIERLRAALEAIAQKANEYGPGHLAAIGCIHDMHALARAGLASQESRP